MIYDLYLYKSYDEVKNRQKVSTYYFLLMRDLYFTVVLTVEQMGHILSLIPIFYQSSIFQIILLASSRGGR